MNKVNRELIFCSSISSVFYLVMSASSKLCVDLQSSWGLKLDHTLSVTHNLKRQRMTSVLLTSLEKVDSDPSTR